MFRIHGLQGGSADEELECAVQDDDVGLFLRPFFDFCGGRGNGRSARRAGRRGNGACARRTGRRWARRGGHCPVCHGRSADGCGFREGAVWQERGHSHGHGQHHEDPDLHHRVGKRLAGGDRVRVRLCSQHAQGKAICEQGGAVHGGRPALLADAGIPQRLRRGVGGARGPQAPGGRAGGKARGGTYGGGEQKGGVCLCRADERKGRGSGLQGQLVHHAQWPGRHPGIYPFGRYGHPEGTLYHGGGAGFDHVLLHRRVAGERDLPQDHQGGEPLLLGQREELFLCEPQCFPRHDGRRAQRQDGLYQQGGLLLRGLPAAGRQDLRGRAAGLRLAKQQGLQVERHQEADAVRG